MRDFRTYFLLVGIFLFVAPNISFAATLSLIPASGSYVVGSTIPVEVLVHSPSTSINAVSGVVTFPPALFSVVSISKSNSVLNFWPTEPSYSQSLGTVSFEGVRISGFQGNTGQVITIVLRAKHAGQGKVAFKSGQVLANNGKGTDITSGLSGTTFTVHTPASPVSKNIVTQSSGIDLLAQITSSTHPIQTKWYNTSHVVLNWTNVQGVTAVRLGYDQNAGGLPLVLYMNPISHKEIDLKDGIWYFHVQEKDSNGWGAVSTFRMQIDSVPPLPILLQFPNGATSTTASLAVSFGTTDNLSGISYYKLTIDGHSFTITWQKGSSVYALPAEASGKHTLLVEAYDKAGNSVEASSSFTIIGTGKKSPTSPLLLFMMGWQAINYISLILVILTALAVGAFGGWYLWHHFHAFRRKYPGMSRETHQALHKQFDKLTEAITAEVMRLEKIKSKRKLTREETQIIENLKKLIQKTEFIVENDISEQK